MKNSEKHNFATPLGILLRAMGDLLVLNLLWLFTAFPIVTMGAASSAVYSVLLRRDRTGELPLFKNYFKNFASGFVHSTLLWLIALVMGFVAVVDIRFALTFEGAMQYIYLALGFIIAVSALIIAFVGIPQQAFFSNSLKGYLKNSFALVAVAPARFLLILLVWAIPVAFLFIFTRQALAKIGVIYFLWGFSAPAYLASHILNKIFDKFGISA